MSQQQQPQSSGRPGVYLHPPESQKEVDPQATAESDSPQRARLGVQGRPGKPMKKQLQVPPDVEPPTMGWPKMKFDKNVRKNVEDPNRPGYYLVPSPNSQELADRAERDLVALIAESKQRQVDLKNERKRSVIVFVNSKGNGATTTSTIWSITGLTIETGCDGWAFDGNSASGTVAQRLGLEGTTISERDLADNLKLLSEDKGALIEYVRSNTDRVRAVAAKDTTEGGRELTAKEYADVAKTCLANAEFMYVDTPNKINSEQCLALLGLADLIVFTANIGEQDSLRKLGTSMETLRNYEANGVSLRNKVNRSVVLFNNMPPGARVEDYLKYRNKVNMANDPIQEFPGHVGPCVSIRHDRAMADARQVDYGALQRETAQEIREFNITVLEQLPMKPPLRVLKRSVHPSFSPQSQDFTES